MDARVSLMLKYVHHAVPGMLGSSQEPLLCKRMDPGLVVGRFGFFRGRLLHYDKRSRTSFDTAPPSALTPTCFITKPITAPICFISVAPVWVTASFTIFANSASLSSSGR